MALSLITNRTATDVSDLKALRTKIINRTATADEWTEWLDNLIAAYNYTDLNRVGNAMDTVTTELNTAPTTLAAYIAALGVAPDEYFTLPYTTPISIVTKTDWTQTDDVQNADMSDFLDSLTTLRAVLTLPADTPNLPASMANINYADANNIETILITIENTLAAMLAELEQYADNTAASWVFCGQPPCGLVNTQFS